MKKLLAVVFAATASALWAMDPIRINFNDKEEYDVDGWRSVSYDEAASGIECVDGVTMQVSGSKGWLYGDGYAIVTNKLQKLYIDDDGWQNPTVVTFSGLKAGMYRLTVYLSSDGSGEGEGAAKYNPIQVNGTWYHYNSEGALVTDKDRWGDTFVKDTGIGTNVLQIAALLITDKTLTLSASRDWGRGGFSAIEICEHDYPPTPSAISINVANADLTNGRVPADCLASGLAGGEIPGYAWLNVSEVSNAFDSVSYWDGESHCLVEGDTGIGVRVTAGGHYWADGASGANAFLQYYLDDNSAPSISVTGIPFKLYDLIVYMNNDWNNGSHKAFNPVTVNGKKYIWDDAAGAVVPSSGEWGARGFETAILGTNALRIVGLTDASLVVSTGSRYYPARGGFAAMQIVAHDYADIVAKGDITTSEVNAKAKEAGKKEVLLTMPEGATLTILPKALDCDTLFVKSDGDVHIATKNVVEPAEGTVYAENYAKINTANVKGLVFHGWKPTKRIISFNVKPSKGAMPSTWTFAGGLAAEEMPSAAWMNLTEDIGTNTMPIVWNGDTFETNALDGATFTWSSTSTYGAGSSPDLFRRGWIDTNYGSGSYKIEGLPFDCYDVIVYVNWDDKGLQEKKFQAPIVNGKQWTYDAEGNVVQGTDTWGSNRLDDPAAFGKNAIRIPDQTASTCTIATPGSICNICAVQIVEYCEKPHDPTQSFILYVK